MTLRLLLDEMYPVELAELLREAGIDAVAVLETVGLPGSADDVVLRRATRLGRAVVTENVGDFLRLADQAHAGMVLVSAKQWPRRPGRWSRIVDALVALDGSSYRDPEVRWLRP